MINTPTFSMRFRSLLFRHTLCLLRLQHIVSWFINIVNLPQHPLSFVDIDCIEICSEEDPSNKSSRRVFSYKVMMHVGGAAMDMREGAVLDRRLVIFNSIRQWTEVSILQINNVSKSTSTNKMKQICFEI